MLNKMNVGGNLVDGVSSSKISDIPQNRTLYVDQFTEKAPDFASEREVLSAHCVDDVFERYRPVVRGVELSTQDETVYEDFSFNGLEDFDDERLVEQSDFMQMSKSRIDALNSAISNLQRNRDMKYVMEDEDAKGNLLEVLKVISLELRA